MGESVVTRCPRTPFDLVAVERPELRYPAGCDTWACVWCGPRLARKRASVLAWAQPERFITLTNAPASWQPLRQRVRTLTMRLRRAGYRCEWAWTVEAGSKTGMVHVHALQHGDYVPQAALQEMWGAITHIRAIRGARGAATYAMKEAGRVAGYAMKGSHEDLLAHLDRNGGRGCHMSRSYLRGKRTREVERILWQSQEMLTWVLVPATDEADEATARVQRVHRDD